MFDRGTVLTCVSFGLIVLPTAGCESDPAAKSDATDATPSDVTSPPDADSTQNDGTVETSLPQPENCSGVDSTPEWTWLDPIEELIDRGLPFATVGNQIGGLAGVAYGNGIFVATVAVLGGDKLRWVTSSDGTTWTAHEEPVPGGSALTTSRVHFQRDRFIFFADFWGGGAWIYTSTNGLDWSKAELGGTRVFAKEFESVGNLTVYVGDSNAMASSADLATFTPRSPTVGSYSFMDIASGAGRFVVTANGGVNGYSSADAITWDPIESLKGFTVEFGRGTFVATAYPAVQTSPDGVTFTPQTPTGVRSGWPPQFAGGRFLTLGNQTEIDMPIAASTDGIAWTPFGAIPLRPLPDGAASNVNAFVDVACSSCTCVFVGLSISTFRGQMPWSQDNYPLIAVARVLAAP